MRVFVFLVLLWTTSVFASSGFVERYTYTNVGGRTAITAPWSTWNTFIAAFGGTTHRQSISRLEFDFITPDYFIEGNRGHFTVGIGYANAVGEGQGLFGHGIIIGNVTRYPTKNNLCKATTNPNNVAIESYFGLDNCVYGGRGSETLENNVWYHVLLEVDNMRETIRVVVTERDTGYLVTDTTIKDVYFQNEHYDYAGWWFAEAFAEQDWVLVLENVEWDI